MIMVFGPSNPYYSGPGTLTNGLGMGATLNPKPRALGDDGYRLQGFGMDEALNPCCLGV